MEHRETNAGPHILEVSLTEAVNKGFSLYGTNADTPEAQRALRRATFFFTHLNLVPFHGIISLDSGSKYLVVYGSVLDEYYKEVTTHRFEEYFLNIELYSLPTETQFSMVMGILDGVEHLHQFGAVHGNIVLPNLIVAEDTLGPRFLLKGYTAGMFTGSIAVSDTIQGNAELVDIYQAAFTISELLGWNSIWSIANHVRYQNQPNLIGIFKNQIIYRYGIFIWRVLESALNMEFSSITEFSEALRRVFIFRYP